MPLITEQNLIDLYRKSVFPDKLMEPEPDLSAIYWKVFSDIYLALLANGWNEIGIKNCSYLSGETVSPISNSPTTIDNVSPNYNTRMKMAFTKAGNTCVITYCGNPQKLNIEGIRIYDIYTDILYGEEFYTSDLKLATVTIAAKAQEVLFVINNWQGSINTIHIPAIQELPAKQYALSSVEEYCRVFTDKEYDWYVYNGENNKKVENKAKTNTAILSKGTRFGLRKATSSKDLYRMVTPQHGKTIVFTLTESMAKSLIANSKTSKGEK